MCDPNAFLVHRAQQRIAWIVLEFGLARLAPADFLFAEFSLSNRNTPVIPSEDFNMLAQLFIFLRSSTMAVKIQCVGSEEP